MSFETGFPWFNHTLANGGTVFFPSDTPFGGKASGLEDVQPVDVRVQLVRIVTHAKSDDVLGTITLYEGDGVTIYFAFEFRTNAANFLPESIDLNITLPNGIAMETPTNMGATCVYRFLA